MRRLLIGLGWAALLIAGLIGSHPTSGQTPAALGWMLYLPDLRVMGAGVATATASSTPSPSATPSPTATSTRLIIIRPTLGPSVTRTATRTPTPDIDATGTPSITPTPSPTPEVLPTRTTAPGAVLILNALADTFVTEGRPTSVWGSFPGMFVGYDWQGWRRQRALIRFDLSSLPDDALILDATLEIFVHNCFECYPIEITTYRITRAWDEAHATWDTSGDTYGEAYGSSLLDPREGRHWETFDVTDLARVWTKGFPNHGLMLRGGEEPVSQDPVLYDFWGLEAREGNLSPPRLMIHWLPE